MNIEVCNIMRIPRDIEQYNFKINQLLKQVIVNLFCFLRLSARGIVWPFSLLIGEV